MFSDHSHVKHGMECHYYIRSENPKVGVTIQNVPENSHYYTADFCRNNLDCQHICLLPASKPTYLMLPKGLFTWRWGTLGRWGNLLRCSKKNNPPYNPTIWGCTFSRLLNGRLARKQEKCWQTTCFGDKCTSTLTCYCCCNLQCNGFILLTLMMIQSHRQSEFCENLMYHQSDPGQAGNPTLKRLHGKIWLRLRGSPGLVDGATRLGGSQHLSCKRDQIKMRDYMVRRVTPPERVTSPT